MDDVVDAATIGLLVKQKRDELCGDEANGDGSGSGDLDIDAVTALSNLLRAAGQLLTELEAEHRPTGWSWAGFRIMFTAFLLGPLEPRQVARLAGVTRASVSAALNTLERDGLVERRRESVDRRFVTIVLTERGHQAVREGFRRQHAVEREWVAGLSRRDLRQLNGLLERLLIQRAGRSARVSGDG